MTFEELIALPIKNIREQTFESGSVYIWFEVENQVFFIFSNLSTKNRLVVSTITHDKKTEKCPVCRKKSDGFSDCSVINRHRKRFFQWLIEQKPLRLSWLYRDYYPIK